MKVAIVTAAALLLAACSTASPGQSAGRTRNTTSPSAVSPGVATSPSADRPHVFVIVLENRSIDEVLGMSYVAQLASKYALATNYHGVSHPSLPNYLALTSGSTWGVADDGYHDLPAGGLGAELSAAGVNWRAYMEGMNNGCFRSGYPYALKHDPFAYYGGTCPAQVVPFSRFSSDMAGDVPNFVWITPDLCHDGHDCSNATVNAWLAQTVPIILGTKAWQEGGVLFITYDEGEDSGNSVLTLVVHPRPILHRSSQLYNHYSLLATIEDELQVARLGAAAHATPMSGLMASWPLLP